VPEDPQALAQRSAATMYGNDLASRHLGIEIDQIAPGQATARMVVRDTMINGHNICHGGYVFLLADTAFAFACNTHGPVTVAAACDIAFLGPAHLGDELIAQATERHHAGRSGIYDVTVRRANTVIAEFRGHSRPIRT
jgi:acyl-CoA thioesterase